MCFISVSEHGSREGGVWVWVCDEKYLFVFILYTDINQFLTTLSKYNKENAQKFKKLVKFHFQKCFSFFLGFWFLNFISNISRFGSVVYIFFLFDRACQDPAHHSVLFLINLCFLIKIQTFIWLDTHLFRSLNFWCLFFNEKVRI